MKKTLSLVAAALLSLGFATKSNAQAVEQGTMLIDATYGFPNLYSSLLQTAFADESFATDIKTSTFGPAAVKFEYLVTDKIGLGLEVNTATSGVSWKETYDDGMGNVSTYEYKVSVPRFRVMPKFAFHFGSNDNFDGYFSVSAGYSSTTVKVTSNEPGYVSTAVAPNLTPFAYRLAVGGRYFFSDAIGANLEFGLGGGALIAGGIAIRLNP